MCTNLLLLRIKSRRLASPLIVWLCAVISICLLSASTVANAQNKDVLVYKYKYGEPGLTMGRFNSIQGIVAVERETTGNTLLVVADKGRNMVTLYTHNMMFIDKWGEAGGEAGQFNEPIGLAIDKANKLYIVDSKNNRIQKTEVGSKTLTRKPGEYLMGFGSYGNGEGQFDTPTDVCVDEDDYIFVVDTGNNRIQKFDAKGVFIKQWGKAGSATGQMKRPTHVSCDVQGELLVADTQNHRIQRFSVDGKFISQFGSVGSGDGEFSEPKGIAIDSSDNIWVVDRRNHRLQVFDKGGKFLATYGTRGEGVGKFLFPEGITIDKNDNVYVTDTRNSRIQVFGIALNRTQELAVSNVGEKSN